MSLTRSGSPDDASPSLEVFVDVREPNPTPFTLEAAAAFAAFCSDLPHPRVRLFSGELEKSKSSLNIFTLWCASCGALERSCDLKKEQRVLPSCIALFPLEGSNVLLAVYTSTPYSLFATSHIAHGHPSAELALYSWGGRSVVASLEAQLPESCVRQDNVPRSLLYGRRAFSAWRDAWVPIICLPELAEEDKGTGFVHLAPSLEDCGLEAASPLPAFDERGLFDGRSQEDATREALSFTETLLHVDDLERPLPLCARCGSATFPRHAQCPVAPDGRVASESVLLACEAAGAALVLAAPRFRDAFGETHFLAFQPIKIEKHSRSIWRSLSALERRLVALGSRVDKAALKTAKKRASQLLTEGLECVERAYHEHEAAMTLSAMREAKRAGDTQSALTALCTLVSRHWVAPEWLSLLMRGIQGDGQGVEPRMMPAEEAELWKRAFAMRRALRPKAGRVYALEVKEDALEARAAAMLDVQRFFGGHVRLVRASGEGKRPFQYIEL